MMEITRMLNIVEPGATMESRMNAIIETQDFARAMRSASRSKKEEEEKAEQMLLEIKLMPDGDQKKQRIDELKKIVADMQAQGCSIKLDQVTTELSAAERDVYEFLAYKTPGVAPEPAPEQAG